MSSEEKISPDEFDQELEALMSGKKEPKKKKGQEKCNLFKNLEFLLYKIHEKFPILVIAKGQYA